MKISTAKKYICYRKGDPFQGQRVDSSLTLRLVMGLVSGFSLANHSDSGSFLVAHALLSQDAY